MTTPAGRVRVKVCGVTRPHDAELAASLGADYLGLNFWPGSTRFVDRSAACEIAATVRGRVGVVGVFVDASRSTVETISEEVGLDLLQFHGNEGPEDLEPFGDRAIKAVRFEGAPEASLFSGYPSAWGFLVEARRLGSFGGTGTSWDYAAAARVGRDLIGGRPLLIAGGLDPENVGAAISASGAWGVDVASGVESAPGVKDPVRLERFFDEVRHASD